MGQKALSNVSVNHSLKAPTKWSSAEDRMTATDPFIVRIWSNSGLDRFRSAWADSWAQVTELTPLDALRLHIELKVDHLRC
jgi:hypothetical protein